MGNSKRGVVDLNGMLPSLPLLLTLKGLEMGSRGTS